MSGFMGNCRHCNRYPHSPGCPNGKRKQEAPEVSKEALHEHQLSWLVQTITTAQNKAWFGTFRVVFEQGKIVRIHAEESMIPPALPLPNVAPSG